ncbi:hypothetical protein C8N43_1944 [Litoreibacter ponti]|uniref:DUF6473 domain-containing protein n=1 Tax=Litoreibacter ponti TaxID=1510457 RepID=A0A2T6BMQ6_9RHOB|nr:DUF6473 family protein [Litoreibacter ponti]PTX57277.1 hypothetical protein C8N43_1944 [Litoreibacter ponti]
MAYERPDVSPLDYQQCRYGQSKLLFRGPRRSLKKEYVAFIGGTETYGKFIEKPFVDQVEDALGIPCANFSAINAGVDAFVHDPSLTGLCNRAQATVVQVMGAQNMSNRFYTVHPRRNDRFLKASTLLKAIYPEVDFTEFSFTRHLLTTLKALSAQRFATIEMELRAAWVGRMESMLRQIAGHKILLWLKEPQPSAPSHANLGAEPLFVDGALVHRLAGAASEIIEIDIHGARGQLEGMCYAPMEQPAAAEMIGIAGHAQIAERMIKALH